MRRLRFCFIATEWGNSEGGESVFNMRLASALTPEADVSCIVLRPTIATPAAVNLQHVKSDGLSPRELAQKIRDEVVISPDWWIGHDVHTGDIANNCRRGLELSCVINHMDYLSYKPYEPGSETLKKSDLQARIFQEADVVAAVGPKLFRTVRDLAPNTRKVQVVPGCEDFPVANSPGRFCLMISGRLTDETDPIKQHRAAVLAFADCVRDRTLGVDPVLTVVGADASTFDEMMKIATERARGGCALVNAGKVMAAETAHLLSRQSVAVVPSIYEGFSLVGWEALSAAVPVILSHNTGLAEFIEAERLPNAVELVRIHGHVAPDTGGSSEPNANDIENLKSAYVRVFVDYAARKSAAIAARSSLRANYRWSDCASSFAADLASVLGEKYYSVVVGVSPGKERVTVGTLSSKVSTTASLANALRHLSRSILIPKEDRERLGRAELEEVAEDTLTRILEAWTEFPWDFYVGYSDKRDTRACVDWLLGMTVPVKGRRVFGVTPNGIDAAEFASILAATLKRTRPDTPAPIRLNEVDDQYVARAVRGLAERVASAVLSDRDPTQWILVMDPRLRAAVAVDERKLYWRKEPLR